MSKDDALNPGFNLPTIGFVVLSHGSPAQLQRLIKAIDREYSFPPIVCHHDFGQARLDLSEFGKNVDFVQPYISTGWGRFSVVKAALASIKQLYATHSPDWFMHLSAADYPIMPGRVVQRQLANASCDVFLDGRPVDPCSIAASVTVGNQNPKLDHFNSDKDRRMKRLFYTSREIWFPLVRLKPKPRLGRFTYRTRAQIKHVYKDFPCFYGDFWFCGNAKTANILLTETEKHVRLARHLQSRTHTDETYFQTVLLNEPGLRVCLDNKRFAEWNGGGAHPVFLGVEHLDEMLSSGAFFARKFKHNSVVLDRIDRVLQNFPSA